MVSFLTEKSNGLGIKAKPKYFYLLQFMEIFWAEESVKIVINGREKAFRKLKAEETLVVHKFSEKFFMSCTQWDLPY